MLVCSCSRQERGEMRKGRDMIEQVHPAGARVKTAAKRTAVFITHDRRVTLFTQRTHDDGGSCIVALPNHAEKSRALVQE